MKVPNSKTIIGVAILVGIAMITSTIIQWKNREKVLLQVIDRLNADSRVAEVLVTDLKYSEEWGTTLTTIKFLEYDAGGKPLLPKFFTFTGNVIQFQSLVMRFDDMKVQQGDKLKGKSAYVFWKVFMLDGKNTEEFIINPIGEIPGGYKVPGLKHPHEQELWEQFWSLALDSKERAKANIKNVQIEAPGSVFLPGVIYTIHIEHDGGLRIDAQPLSPILRGETIRT